MSDIQHHFCAVEGAYGRRFFPLFEELRTVSDDAFIIDTDALIPSSVRIIKSVPDIGRTLRPDAFTFIEDPEALFRASAYAVHLDDRMNTLPISTFDWFFVFSADAYDAFPILAHLARSDMHRSRRVDIRNVDGSVKSINMDVLARQGWDHRLKISAWMLHNAWPVLRHILQDLGAETNDLTPLSIEDVQELYRIREGKPFSADQFNRQAWRAYVLRHVGLVSGTWHPEPTLTPLGHAFLAKLHRSSRDPKFTDRVKTWSRDWDQAEDKAKTWIRTWCGRLQRKALSS